MKELINLIKENYLLLLITIPLLLLIFYFNKELFYEFVKEKMLEAEANWEVRGGGKEKLEKVLIEARKKSLIFRILSVNLQIKIIERLYKKIRNRIINIKCNKEAIAINSVNKVIAKAIKTDFKGDLNVISNEQLLKLENSFKNDYRGYVDIGATTDFKEDHRAEIKVGYKW